jgi:hypothetical protein
MASETYLLFVSRSTGYQLVERPGQPPLPGDDVDLGDDGGRLVVSKVGPSPLPGDSRPCAYLQQR